MSSMLMAVMSSRADTRPIPTHFSPVVSDPKVLHMAEKIYTTPGSTRYYTQLGSTTREDQIFMYILFDGVHRGGVEWTFTPADGLTGSFTLKQVRRGPELAAGFSHNVFYMRRSIKGSSSGNVDGVGSLIYNFKTRSFEGTMSLEWTTSLTIILTGIGNQLVLTATRGGVPIAGESAMEFV